MFDLLLDKGADINAAKTDGAIPLYIAVEMGHLEIARLLLDRGANSNAACTDGATPLLIAAQKGHLEVVRLLLDRGANSNAARTDGATPLHIAAQKGHLEIARLLLDRGAQINAARTTGATPLHLAALNGHLELVKQLVVQGANRDAQLNIAHHSQIPADVAASPAIREYLTRTAPNTLFWTLKLLKSAENQYQPGIVTAIQNNAEVNAEQFPGGNTALHYAAQKNNIPMAKYLIAHGANINARNIEGDTALHIATRNRNRAMIFVLLANNANPRFANYHNETPVQLAGNAHFLLETFMMAAVPQEKDPQSLRDYFSRLHQK